MKHKYKYNYFYKITNNINGKFYYGIHSTDNLNDGYMGSGTRLNKAYKKYGKENFSKEILKFFDTREELSDYEEIIVNESLIHDDDCYNISLGGETMLVRGSFTAFNKENKTWERITNEEFLKNPDNYITSVFTDKVIAKKQNDSKYILIDKDEFHKNRDEYVYKDDWKKDKMIVLDKSDNQKIIINKNDFDIEKYIPWPDLFQKEQVVVRDKDGNILKVHVDDPRYLSGELVFAYTGYKWSDEQKLKLKEKFKKTNHQKGERNSQFGKKWIYKGNDCIKVKKEDLQFYLENGWKLGCLKTRKKIKIDPDCCQA